MVCVSVVTGTYKRLPYLKEMVASVRQSILRGISYEIIVVDGGSTDGTIAWCKQQRDIRLIEQGRLLGAIKAFAAGFAVARGKYVVIANDDLTFTGDSITRAIVFMQDHPTVGIGLFYTNRAQRHDMLHVAMMPAYYENGGPTSVPYGGICITPKFLGDQMNWWHVPGGYTYGGDNALCARVYEAGWAVEPIPDASVWETIPHDELNAINNPPSHDDHPDTKAYLKIFPNGPAIRYQTPPELPKDMTRPMRSVHAPIYETKHKAQHEQKRALTLALSRVGQCVEIDYAATGADEILHVAQVFKPDLMVLQLHYADPFTVWHARKLREILPTSKLVAWNGDVYDRSTDAIYVNMLESFDLLGVVNVTARDNYRAKGVRAEYWQVPYEPDGVGHDPLPSTPKYDLLFLGNGYSPERVRFAKRLRLMETALGIKVGIYGHYPGSIADGENLYDFREGCRLMRNAKLVVADSQWPTQAVGFTSNRLFQALAAGGGLLLQQWFEGMEEYLGLRHYEHLAMWHEPDRTLESTVAYWLEPEQDADRNKIVRAGQLEVLTRHSGDARIRELLAWLTPPGEQDPTLANYHAERKYA